MQDDEYLASLQTDQEKELKAKAKAEARRIEEEAAREAALEDQRRKEEETERKLVEEQVLMVFFPFFFFKVIGCWQHIFPSLYLLASRWDSEPLARTDHFIGQLRILLV